MRHYIFVQGLVLGVTYPVKESVESDSKIDQEKNKKDLELSKNKDEKLI